MFNPYLDRRDFRLVIFKDDELSEIEQVADLFDGELSSRRKDRLETHLGGATITTVTATYYSKNCFLRTTDPEKRDVLRARRRVDQFQYDVYILSYRKLSQQLFAVAIPFSAMARELFGKIHERKPSSNFVYLKPAVNSLVNKLVERFIGSERIKVMGINWAVAGDTGRSDQVILRGSDVIHSNMFKQLRDTKGGLAISARKVQVRFEAPGGTEPLRVAFDKFGNYSVWVRPEGTNLPVVFQLFELLNKAKLIDDERAFPVRNRDEEPVLV